MNFNLVESTAYVAGTDSSILNFRTSGFAGFSKLKLSTKSFVNTLIFTFCIWTLLWFASKAATSESSSIVDNARFPPSLISPTKLSWYVDKYSPASTFPLSTTFFRGAYNLIVVSFTIELKS